VQRFLDRVEESPDGCWMWKGSVYGNMPMLSVKSGYMSAARISYAIYNGPIPEGARVYRTCHNKTCINPARLKLSKPIKTHTTPKYKLIGMTTCEKGHPWVISDKRCMICSRERQKMW